MTRTSVLIIGGGIAGVSLGSELARDHDVTVLEAETALATHSTGRSAALYVEGYGGAPVQALTRASRPMLAELSRRHGRPLLIPRGGVLTAWDDATAAGLEAQLERDPTLERLTARQVAELCPVVRSEGVLLAAIDRDACDLDVMALHEIFTAELRRRGGRTVTSARMVEAKRSSRWRVTTADGRTWMADLLVDAAGAWGDSVAALAGVRGHGLSPRRRTVVIARTSTPLDLSWPVIADAGEQWYFKPEGNHVLLSPGDETPCPAGDARPDPLDVAAALERVNATTTLDLRSVHTAWAGLRTFAPDRVPVVGAHPDEPSLFCFLGQGGYGIQMAPALAVVGADLFRGGSPSLAPVIDPRRFSAAAAPA